MWNLFSDIKKMGFGKLDESEFYEKEDTKKKEPEVLVKAPPVEQDFLFDKRYECPVCANHFISKTVRARKAKLLETDTDLRPIYEHIEPLKYSVIVCPHCGYAAFPRLFEHISTTQKKLVRENVTSQFKGISNSNADVYTFEEAEERYKLAMVNAVAMKLRNSERAYLCLRLGWMYRAQKEELLRKGQEEQYIAQIEEKAMSCIRMAYEGFQMSYAKEIPPICGMDADTLTYLLAELGRQCGDYATSMRYVEILITSRTANERVKERARFVRDLVKKEMNSSYEGK